MQWAPLSRMLASMNEASPIDPATATTATDVTTAPAAAIGVLLVNLGTPDAADAPAVRRYLKEFLSDPRVIENQGLVWQAVLNGIILPIRPRIKAKDYQKIWNVERNESPLKTITRAQAEKLGQALAPLGPQLIVDWAMRYGNPSIESRLASLIARGCERILIMPLYPQYSAATTATVCDEVFRVMMGLRRQPTVRVAAPYYDDKVYIDALAASVRDALGKRGVKSIAVVTPGFSADCLETLEEIAAENAHIFRKAGGENFAAIPCLNDSAPGMLLLEDMARRELQGWV
jgi:ferrochelatase